MRFSNTNQKKERKENCKRKFLQMFFLHVPLTINLTYNIYGGFNDNKQTLLLPLRPT